jgi:hypothetical protein
MLQTAAPTPLVAHVPAPVQAGKGQFVDWQAWADPSITTSPTMTPVPEARVMLVAFPAAAVPVPMTTLKLVDPSWMASWDLSHRLLGLFWSFRILFWNLMTLPEEAYGLYASKTNPVNWVAVYGSIWFRSPLPPKLIISFSINVTPPRGASIF